MEPSTRTSASNDTDHHSTSLPQHKPSAQLSGGTPSTAVSPAFLLLPLLSPCLGNSPSHVNRGRARTVIQSFIDSCFREKMRTPLDVMDKSCCGASCLDLVVWTSLCHLQESASHGSLGQWSGSLWLLLNQIRAASESWGKQPASRVGTRWGRRQFNRENDNP